MFNTISSGRSSLLASLFVGAFGILLTAVDPEAAAPVPSQVKDVVAFVFAKGEKPGEIVAWGTAFFVGVKHPANADRLLVYLVTARHVLKTADQKAWLPSVLVRLNARAGGTQVAEVPVVPSGDGQNVFVHSTDPTVDIAVIPFVPNERVVDFKVVTDDMLTSKEDFNNLQIREGSEVFFTGLFSPFVGTRRNYPVVRFGRVALIANERIKFVGGDADLYLVETGSYGGNSGSPVFFYFGAEREAGSLHVGPPVLKLAGIMSGTFMDNQPIRLVEQVNVPVAPSSMGIAAVAPAFKLKEILGSPEVVSRISPAAKAP